MFRIDHLRLTPARHLAFLNQLSRRARPHSMNSNAGSLSSSASRTSRRDLSSSPQRSHPTAIPPTRGDFGFVTLPTNSRLSSSVPRRLSRPSGRRHYNSGSSGGYRGSSSSFTVDQAYWLLFSINAASFATWWYARLTQNNKLVNLHANNTLVSLVSVESGRYWTLLTSAFAHHDIMHFAFNMLTLRTFCSIIGFVPGIGGAHVLAITLGSALAGSGGFLWQQRQKLTLLKARSSTSRWTGGGADVGQAYHASALGASGVVMGVSAVATCLLPQMPISLMFIPIGIPLWMITIGYAVVDSYYLDSPTSRIAHSGHLGGLVAGAAYYALVLRKAPVGIWRTLTSKVGRR